MLYNDLGQQPEALKYYEEALPIRREVGDRFGEGITLGNIGARYFEQARYDVALACFLLARSIFDEVQSPDRDVMQGWIDGLHNKVGKNKFAALLTEVESHASQILEKALKEGL